MPSRRLRFLSLSIASALVAVVLLLPAGLRPHGAAALTNCDVADASVDNDERAMLGLINAYRAQNGAPALSIGQPLTVAATWLAQDMGAQNYFSHTDLLGRDSFMRMADCDVPGSDLAGENISAGYQAPQATFDQWKASAEHNANMLNPGFHSIGIARAAAPTSTYKYYWVTTFSAEVQGSAAAASAPPPPAPAPAPAAPPPPAACTGAGLAPSTANALAVNKTVRFTAAITCGGTANFEWWGGFVFPNGDILWQQLTPSYGLGFTYDWTPKAPGTYAIGFWAQNAGVTPANGKYDVVLTQNYTVK